MGELVRLHTEQRVATITLDSQHNRNALSQQLLAELHECLDAAESARIIVLTNAGPTFCAGADLKERADRGKIDARPMASAMQRLMTSACPTIAAVNGAARAGGIGLMAACDLVVVARPATFALSEVRIGVAPAVISVPILNRVPASKIAGAMLTGQPFDSAEALTIGLVTHVADDVDATVRELCAAILAGAPNAVAATKQILRTVPGLDHQSAFDQMRQLSDELFNSPEGTEGMAAFREKRPPVWPATS